MYTPMLLLLLLLLPTQHNTTHDTTQVYVLEVPERSDGDHL
jgi:hypothetical protein